MIQFEEKNSWNHLKWLSQFKRASKMRDGFRELRIQVFQNTVRLVKTGFYFVGGEKVFLDNQHTDFQGTLFYESPDDVSSVEAKGACKVSVINADCVETARLVALSGYNPVVLNMANGENPGGGVLRGAGAQEENIFRRSNLFQSLFQFVGYGEKAYNIQRNLECSYPLHPETGGIYSPNITIFRGSEHNGYCLLRQPYQLAFATVAAIYNPKLVTHNGVLLMEVSFIEATKQKIRTILRIAILNGHDSAVLSAFGCGAFCNPPNHVALLFQEVFEELEFRNKLKLIVFAIIDDHNANKPHNPMGNVLPFLQVFE